MMSRGGFETKVVLYVFKQHLIFSIRNTAIEHKRDFEVYSALILILGSLSVPV